MDPDSLSSFKLVLWIDYRLHAAFVRGQCEAKFCLKISHTHIPSHYFAAIFCTASKKAKVRLFFLLVNLT